MAQNKIFRISTTIVLILVLLGIILYPKLKPMFQSDKGGMPASGQRFSRGGRPDIIGQWLCNRSNTNVGTDLQYRISVARRTG